MNATDSTTDSTTATDYADRLSALADSERAPRLAALTAGRIVVGLARLARESGQRQTVCRLLTEAAALRQTAAESLLTAGQREYLRLSDSDRATIDRKRADAADFRRFGTSDSRDLAYLPIDSRYATLPETGAPAVSVGTDGVGTDRATPATQDTTVRIVSESVAVADDGQVTVTLAVRYWVGSCEHVGFGQPHIGSGSGSDYRRAAMRAMRAATATAQAFVSRSRASMRVIAATESEALTATEYAQLGGYVRRAYFGSPIGNGSRSSREFMRAGVTASGVPIDVHAVSDGTGYAAEILLSRRAARPLTTAEAFVLAAVAADSATAAGIRQTARRALAADVKREALAALPADVAARFMLADAARDGLRKTTAHKTATAAAEALTEWEQSLSGGYDGSEGSAARSLSAGSRCRCAGFGFADHSHGTAVRIRETGSQYIGSGTADTLTDAALSVSRSDRAALENDGSTGVFRPTADSAPQLRFPMLARFMMTVDDSRKRTGSVAATARALFGSDSYRQREAVAVTLRTEYAALAATDSVSVVPEASVLAGMMRAR